MYRIVKRIVHTITTVIWLIRLDDQVSPDGKPVEKEITFPASHSLKEEEVTDTITTPKELPKRTQPIPDKGEKHEQ